MNDRQKSLLRIFLMNPNKVFQVNELRQTLHCSEKTVRNDLNVIEDYIKPYQQANLNRKRGIGISLHVSNDIHKEIFQDLYQIATTTDEELLIEVAYQLLTSTHPLTLKSLAEKYFTNPSTIKQELDKVNQWIAQFDLQIVTRQRVGSFVEGTELNKRNALAHLSELVSSEHTKTYVLDFFHDVETRAVKKGIRDTQRKFNLEISDGRLESLVIHALIMIKRTRQQNPIAISREDKEKTLNTKQYELTTYLIDKLEDLLRLKIPTNERVYYAWHVSGAIQNTDLIDPLTDNKLVEQTVKNIIQHVQQLTNIPFDEDAVLLDGLTVHINAAMKRISYGFHITNPMLHEIKRLYPYLFSMIVFTLNDIKKQHDLTIPEEEAAYLTLHFQAAIERMEKEQTPKKALIVCHMGVGMSLLLRAKIEQQYQGIEIIDCIAQNELHHVLKCEGKMDLIISTVPLNIHHIPIVSISPLLNANDKKKLNHFLREDINEQSEKDFPTLHQFIKNGLFQRDIDLDHPYKIVERLANQLVRIDAVEETFTHNILLRERASFTSIGGKIAIPHAQPSSVKKSTLSTAILKKPIQWGPEMVSIVFVLAISKEDRWMTQDLLKEISNLSENPTLIHKLINVNNKQELEKLFG